MKIPQLAFVLLLLSAAFAAAQNAPAPPVTSSAAPHFDIKRMCALPGVICDTFGASSGQIAGDSAIKPFAGTLNSRDVVIAMNPDMPKNCYTMRAYEYSTGEPGGGKVRRTGMTSCQPATNFHMRSATLNVPAPGQSR